MACHLFGAKPLSKQMASYCQLEPCEQTWVKFSQNTKRFVHENASENSVCKKNGGHFVQGGDERIPDGGDKCG